MIKAGILQGNKESSLVSKMIMCQTVCLLPEINLELSNLSRSFDRPRLDSAPSCHFCFSLSVDWGIPTMQANPIPRFPHDIAAKWHLTRCFLHFVTSIWHHKSTVTYPSDLWQLRCIVHSMWLPWRGRTLQKPGLPYGKTLHPTLQWDGISNLNPSSELHQFSLLISISD